jgi:hypothetical protein
MFNYTNTIIVNSNTSPAIKILSGLKVDNITLITKRAATAGIDGKIAFTIPENGGKVEILGALSGNVNSSYATSLSYSNIIIAVEFADSDSLINSINGLGLPVTASFSAGTLTITGDKYTQFTGANVYTWDSANKVWAKTEKTPTITPCVNPFGTYEQLTKDVKLLSEANTGLMALNKDELPIYGDLYDQYIINYKVEDRKLGTGAVGATVTSTTQHVLFINTKATDVIAGMGELGTVVEVK